MGKEIKEERIEYKREGAMSFRAVANQTNGRWEARQKENERWKQGTRRDDAIDRCNGNPTKQWHGDVHSISLIA